MQDVPEQPYAHRRKQQDQQTTSLIIDPIRTGSKSFPELNEREREILELIAQGLTNPAIAERLVLSPKTVRNHVFNIFSKLQVSDRSQAIVKARQAGMGDKK